MGFGNGDRGSPGIALWRLEMKMGGKAIFSMSGPHLNWPCQAWFTSVIYSALNLLQTTAQAGEDASVWLGRYEPAPWTQSSIDGNPSATLDELCEYRQVASPP